MSAAERRYRVGVVGASFGGSVHVPAYVAQGRFDVVALASPNRAADVAKARKIPHAFATTDEMLAACELDVLSVASPPFDHRATVLAGLARGLHVMCEKPFALNVADAEEMTEAAARAGTVCAIAHEFRYTPSRAAIRELVENGHLGALRAIEMLWYSTMLRADRERPHSWWFERAKGGGITGAILSHLIDQSTWLAGRAPLRATGYERTANPDRHANGAGFRSDVADGAFVTIDYGDGLIATVTADGTRAVDGTTVAVHGESRTVRRERSERNRRQRRSSSTTRKRRNSNSHRNRTRISRRRIRISRRSSPCSTTSSGLSTARRRAFRPSPTASRPSACSRPWGTRRSKVRAACTWSASGDRRRGARR